MHLQSDATAAVELSRRLGAGRVRHLDTSLLWIQSNIRSGDIKLGKIDGTSNCAESRTKHVERSTLDMHLQSMGLVMEPGRPESAPNIVASLLYCSKTLRPIA